VVTRRAETPSPFAAGLLFSFTAAYLYQQDSVEGEPARADGLDRELLGQLVAPQDQEHLLDPRAVHLVERRLRGVGRPPRSAAEMAEWLLRLGDLSAAELEGPMAGFLEQLQAEGLVEQIELPGGTEPQRWLHVEEAPRYRRAFGLVEATPAQVQEDAAIILARFLDTHALVGQTDVLARYPFESAWAQRQIEEWVRVGRAVRVSRREGEAEQYAVPGNLEQVQRGSLGLLRKEVLTCQPAQFADFVLRWQHLHPAERRGTSAGLAEVLERLQGVFLLPGLWEESVLPARVPGYQPRWLDEWVSSGSGVWLGQGAGGSGLEQVAFLGRGLLGQLAPPELPDLPALSEAATRVAEVLQKRGASFLLDLSNDSGLSPGAARSALWELARRAAVSNDQFDVVRRGEPAETVSEATRRQGPRLRSLRRLATGGAEGRWSLLSWGRPEPEVVALAQCMLLLQRYGVAARELALMEGWLLPWRILYEVLSRLELAGEVRRGYFVEGLSGAQFALPEAVERLQQLHAPAPAAAPVVLVHSQDPANLYGAGAPFDVPLLDGGARPLLRRAGNWLVLRAGRPVLLVEGQGKRLTALASSSRDDVVEAVRCLPGMFDARSLAARHKLSVELWNSEPVTTSPGREVLEAAGFVRDYQCMTLYAAWR
jgi:ATP-dependent Lhr-like helicase